MRVFIKGALLPIFLLLMWFILTELHWVNSYLIPSPAKVMVTVKSLWNQGVLQEHIIISLERVLKGFCMTFFLAFPLAVLLGLKQQFNDYLNPVLHFLRQVPPIACIPLLILWLGIGEASKLAVIILAAFFPIFLNTLDGFLQCDPKLLEVGQVFRFSKSERFWKILFPSALPSIILGLRLGLGYSWRALIAAELIAASSGLGYMMIEAEQISRPDIVIIGILVIGSLGYVMDYLFLQGAARLRPWQRKQVDHGFADHKGTL